MSRVVKVILSAEEAAGVQALRLLTSAGHDVVAVLTRPASEIDGLRGTTVYTLARRLGYPTRPAALVTDANFADEVRRLGVDLILNVHSLFIMHSAVAASPRIGAFNLHPGPLPSYAGLNAPSWAMLHGESQYGVTLHWMEAGVDTGAIAYQTRFPIGPTDTALTLYRRCVQEGVQLISKLLDTTSERSAVPRHRQDLSGRSYFGRDLPHGGALDWTWRARYVVDFVRACDYHPMPSPWGYPRARMDGEEIAIARAQTTGCLAERSPGTVTSHEHGVAVACRDEWINVTHVWLDGARLPASDALSGVSRLTSGV